MQFEFKRVTDNLSHTGKIFFLREKFILIKVVTDRLVTPELIISFQSNSSGLVGSALKHMRGDVALASMEL